MRFPLVPSLRPPAIRVKREAAIMLRLDVPENRRAFADYATVPSGISGNPPTGPAVSFPASFTRTRVPAAWQFAKDSWPERKRAIFFASGPRLPGFRRHVIAAAIPASEQTKSTAVCPETVGMRARQ